ncbi:MAG: hypothetical protein EOP04_20330, partial [Proteobacteria bacterium]
MRKALASAVLNIINLSSGLLLVKAIAYLFGASALGYYSVMVQARTLISSALTLGMEQSLSRAAARSTSDVRRLFAIVMTQIILIVLILITISVYDHTALNFFLETSGQKFPNLILYVICASLFFSVLSICQSILAGVQRTRELIWIGLSFLISGLIGTAALKVFIGTYNPVAIAALITFNALTAALCGIYFVIREIRAAPPSNLNGLQRKNLKEYSKIFLNHGIYSLLILLMFNYVQLFTRSTILESIGEKPAGLFFAAQSLSLIYTGPITTFLALQIFPKFARTTDLTGTLEISRNYFLTASIYIFLVMIAVVGLFPIMAALVFSKEFLGAERIIIWVLAVDFFRIIYWYCCSVIAANNRFKELFLLEIFHQGLSYISIRYALSEYPREEMASIAMVFTYGISTPLYLFV